MDAVIDRGNPAGLLVLMRQAAPNETRGGGGIYRVKYDGDTVYFRGKWADVLVAVAMRWPASLTEALSHAPDFHSRKALDFYCHAVFYGDKKRVCRNKAYCRATVSSRVA